MSQSSNAHGVLLVAPNSVQRRELRRALSSGQLSVVTANSLAEAIGRLRNGFYTLVVCMGHSPTANLHEEYAVLISTAGLLSRSATGVALYLPGIGIGARAVLLHPWRESERVRTNVSDALLRLERMGHSAAQG